MTIQIKTAAALCAALALAGCGQSDATPRPPAAAAPAQGALPGPMPEPAIPTGPMTVQQELATVLFNVCLPASRGGAPLTAGSPVMKALGDPAVTTDADTGETLSTFKTPRGLTVYLVPGSGHCEVSTSGVDLAEDIDLFTSLDPLVKGWTLLGDGVLGSPDYRFAIVESVRYQSAEFNRYTAPPPTVKAHYDLLGANAALPFPAVLKKAVAACPRYLAIVKLDDGPPEVNGFAELSELGNWSFVGGSASLETNAGLLYAVDGHCEILISWDSGDAEAARDAAAKIQTARTAFSNPTSGYRAAGAEAWTAPDGSRVAFQQEDGSAHFIITPKA